MAASASVAGSGTMNLDPELIEIFPSKSLVKFWRPWPNSPAVASPIRRSNKARAEVRRAVLTPSKGSGPDVKAGHTRRAGLGVRTCSPVIDPAALTLAGDLRGDQFGARADAATGADFAAGTPSTTPPNERLSWRPGPECLSQCESVIAAGRESVSPRGRWPRLMTLECRKADSAAP